MKQAPSHESSIKSMKTLTIERRKTKFPSFDKNLHISAKIMGTSA